MAKEARPDPTLHSGWCMKWPVSEYNEAEHDKCPMHFSTRSCACTCGHKGERTLESRGMTYQPRTTPKALKITTDEGE